MMMRIFVFILFFGFASISAHAACTAPTETTLGTGQLGEIKMSIGALNKINNLYYCDGSNWLNFGGTPTATACTKNGEIAPISGEMHFCNVNKWWRFDSGAATNGACTKNGDIRSGASHLEFCNAGTWRVVSTDNTEDAINTATYNNTEIGEFIGVNFLASGYTGTKTATIDFSSFGSCDYPRVKICGNASCDYNSASISSRDTSGTLSVPSGSYIYAFMGTSQSISTTCSIGITLGSQNFSLSATTGTSDNIPTFSFASTLRSQTPSTTVESGIIRMHSFTSATMQISDAGTGGSPEFRICADSLCLTEVVGWGSVAQVISNQQYYQLRTTTGAGTQNLRRVGYQVGGHPFYYWNVMTSTCPATTTLASAATLACTCPAGYQTITGGVTGSTRYAQTSDLCGAALHAGTYSNATGGSITAKGLTAASCPSFTGSAANGVTSSSSGSAAAAMYFVGFGTDACI